MNGLHNPQAEPPEGVLSGDSIPRENEATERAEREAVDRLVAQLKTRPGFQRYSDDKLREIAKEKLL